LDHNSITLATNFIFGHILLTKFLETRYLHSLTKLLAAVHRTSGFSEGQFDNDRVLI